MTRSQYGFQKALRRDDVSAGCHTLCLSHIGFVVVYACAHHQKHLDLVLCILTVVVMGTGWNAKGQIQVDVDTNQIILAQHLFIS